MKSLRDRLLVGTAAAVAAVLSVAGWSLHALVESALADEVDRALGNKAAVLASAVGQIGNALLLEFEDLDLRQFADPERGEFLQLWAGGELLYAFPEDEASGFVPEASEPESAGAWLDLPHQARGRVLVHEFEPAQLEPEEEDEDWAEEEAGAQPELGLDDVPSGPAQIRLVLAGEAGEADRALATLRRILWVVGLATLVATALVLFAVVGRSLRPVGALSSCVARIGEDSLSTRLDARGVPGELLPVVERVNGLLERLEGAFERERAFSNDVAHELRTPLAGLRATLEVTAQRPRSAAEYAEALGEAAGLAEQLQSMVERLLQLARLDAGRVAAESAPYGLSDVAVEAWEPFAATALARDLGVELDLQNGGETCANRELVEIILRNLYENAVTYTDEGGRVAISTRRADDGRVTLEVRNTGSLLDSQQLSSATQRFWRGDTARTEAGLHCGLGLALVEKAAAALSARLELRSQEGGEFKVSVELPA